MPDETSSGSTTPMMANTNVRYFTPSEVRAHHLPTDIWVSWLGDVYDLTSVIQQNKGSPLALPMLQVAGSDISHWFNPKTMDLKRCISPLTNTETYATPHGRVIDMPPLMPHGQSRTDVPSTPWWRNLELCIGRLSAKTRFIRLLNTLTQQEDVLEVCSEETIYCIQERYRKTINCHGKAYVWKRLGILLDMAKTLEENGIPDDSEEFERLGKDNPDDWLPVIHVYFTDDLTVDPVVVETPVDTALEEASASVSALA